MEEIQNLVSGKNEIDHREKSIQVALFEISGQSLFGKKSYKYCFKVLQAQSSRFEL